MNAWEEIYKANRHMVTWPWSDIVSDVMILKPTKNLKVLEIGCDAFYTDGDTYSQYVYFMEDYDGRWSLSVDKQDEEGSNCPTIEELIYQVSQNDKNNYLALYLSYTITAMIIMCLCMICRKCMKKEDYEKTDSDDVVMKESV